MIPVDFHPIILEWFHSRFQQATRAQIRGWPPITAGSNTLIAAPTGSGKTLAAFLAILDRLFRRALKGELTAKTQVVYVSPLRALSNDIHRNLETPLAEIAAIAEAKGLGDPGVKVAVRTGDTPSSQRQAMVRNPPNILVTTPESLYLLLTAASGQAMLAEVETLIVDEIHALADNRRGSHLSLSMERLADLAPKNLQRVGLSATQSPMQLVADFLVGQPDSGEPTCEIIDEGHLKSLDLKLIIPDSPLEAVISHEVWAELYADMVARIQEHRTTLVFVQTRALAERVTFNLTKYLGEKGQIAAHHGSMSADMRHHAESELKSGRLKAIVATASLELGIDIGYVDQVIQIGSPRAIAALLQRVGRSGHHYGGVPKGRLYPLTRDQLLEATALVDAIDRGNMDQLTVPHAPLDILAQQIVASVASTARTFDELFALVRRAYPYRNLDRETFENVVRMLADGIATRRGRRGAHIYYDAINGTIKGRRGAGLNAITCGGAIPDNADFKVILEPQGTYLGSINEDFAIEASKGDIFQLGNTSWQIAKVETGIVRVHDAAGQPPTIPFWLGEAPGRTDQLSLAVSGLRIEAETILNRGGDLAEHLAQSKGVSRSAAEQMAAYLTATHKALGTIPSQKTIVMERFFDEGGGMQLILHAPFGNRINRAWGLALRKRFCRSFNFELQAAATDDAILLSLGPTHAFPLADVFDYLHPCSVRDVLIQAMLDAPMFPTRFRWNAQRALAIARQRGGKRVPPFLQRMASDDLMAVVFPDQLACQENLAGDREVPDHPLVNQTIDDCLQEVMDLDGLIVILNDLKRGAIRKIALDLPEPSPMAHEVLNASLFAFLDDAGLEERRTQAVHLRRTLAPEMVREVGMLDDLAIETVHQQAWPNPAEADEWHEALLQCGGLTMAQVGAAEGVMPPQLDLLLKQKRASQLRFPKAHQPLIVAAEREPMWRQAVESPQFQPKVTAPDRERSQEWTPESARMALVRGYMEVAGPTTASLLSKHFGFGPDETDQALLQLEGEGTILRGQFDSQLEGEQWCHRGLLARIHRLTLNRLRAEIQPVTAHIFMRFLFHWQKVEPESRSEGMDSLMSVIGQLEGFEAAAGRWESDILPQRVKNFSPAQLDQLCLQGRIGWGRRTISSGHRTGRSRPGPLKTSPMALFPLEALPNWFEGGYQREDLSVQAQTLAELLHTKGALFFHQITQQTGWLHTQTENTLGELVAAGLASADSFAGLRALLTPSSQRPSPRRQSRRGRQPLNDVALAGRWTLLRAPSSTSDSGGTNGGQPEHIAQTLLRRYGIVFRKLLENEGPLPPWRDLLKVFRRMEAKGQIRGGHFVSGFGGEHFALPEAVGLVRRLRREPPPSQPVIIHAHDPLNLLGIILPGQCVPRQQHNRILMLDGLPMAARIGKEIKRFEHPSPLPEAKIQALLKEAASRGKRRRRFVLANTFQ